ncbi:MAG: translational GTPase TypA [Candidatus Omnitrophica bacterium]|nr:translational GTPase TypA [Candidatus Omnitrophota bacterium]
MSAVRRDTLRNIAIIAHVDHGKTTLVDAMLKQTHVHRNIESMGERIMDSMDLERERGITIRAKNASVVYEGVKINIVDTPGHADFGGEVERTLRMVDGVLILIDAKEGPMPQTKFVLRKALALGHPAIVVINKIDRSDARIDDVVNRTFDLFVELSASHEQLDFAIVYTVATAGTATLDPARPGQDLVPLFQTILERIPAPMVNATDPFQMLVLALAYDSYKGKMGIGKIQSGALEQRQAIVRIAADGTQTAGTATDILIYRGLERVAVDRAEAGEIVAVAGLSEIGIGETIADAEHPVALPPVAIDLPTMQMTLGVNTSPFSGQEGKYVTSRALRERLDKELETNVSLRVAETDSPDTFLVSGRGELHLAIVIETMRREGFELQVSQPQVIFQEEGGRRLEPYEELSIDVPSEYQGTVIEEVGRRRGELTHMTVTPTGEVHLEYVITTRGLLGLKRTLLTKTRGTIILHHVFDSYRPAQSVDLTVNAHGSLVAFEDGVSNTYGLANAEGRGELFIGPGVKVYQGMIVGENARDLDIDVNICKQKKLTNQRSSTSDIAIQLTPPRELTLELALEYIAADELVEVTPANIRLRKRMLDPLKRKRGRRDQDEA